ncbi:MAG: hypothetical protein ABI885_19690 [Gammaproteobacteria bacterium]
MSPLRALLLTLTLVAPCALQAAGARTPSDPLTALGERTPSRPAPEGSVFLAAPEPSIAGRLSDPTKGPALRVLIVSGLGGEPTYALRFEQQADALSQAATRAGATQDNITTLTGGHARRDTLTHELTELARKTQPNDQVVIVLIGHGAYDGTEYRLNLPGPDITGHEIGALLDKLPATRQLIVNATSASGAVADLWKRPNRIVITATRSGSERNATRFAQFWVEALSSSEADRDKNESVTVTEAYEFASRKVADTFKADAALATEHSRIEGGSANSFVVARLGTAAALPDDAALTSLLAEQADIEQQLEAIKVRKASLDKEQYYTELEKVLITLAQLDRRIDDRKSTLLGTTTRDANATQKR